MLLFSVECTQWFQFINHPECLKKSLVNNNWKQEDELTSLADGKIKDLMVKNLSWFYNGKIHTSIDLARREPSGDKGSLCGMAAVYKAALQTILSEFQLKLMSYDEVKVEIGKYIDMSPSLARKQIDLDFLSDFYQGKLNVWYLLKGHRIFSEMCTRPKGVIFEKTSTGKRHRQDAQVSAAISGQHCCDTCVEVWTRDDRDMWIAWVPVGNGGDSMRCRCKYQYINHPQPTIAGATTLDVWHRGKCHRQSSGNRKKRSLGNHTIEDINLTDVHDVIEELKVVITEEDSDESHFIDKRQAPAVIETEEEIEMRSFGSQLRYECGLGRRFFDTEMEEHYEERWMTCNWNTTWTKYESLDDCVWIQCINPPPPPEGTGLVSNYDGEAVEFFDNNTYVCQEGLYFEWDRDMPEFNITCLPGGAWDEPIIWPICLAGENVDSYKYLY